MPIPVNPFDGERLIGSITQVGPSSARLNLPYAANPSPRLNHGKRVGSGEVGEFVVIECGELAILGRILETRLPERERLGVEPELGKEREVNPVGTLQLLATIELDKSKTTSGILRYPRLGNSVYSAPPELIQWLVESPGEGEGSGPAITLQIAKIPNASEVKVSMTPEKLFGRHCAILGSTGGGKSWSLSRILEELANYPSKAILLDATGEFHEFSKSVIHVHLGEKTEEGQDGEEVVYPYTDLTEGDLFSIFNPSGQSQAPKLRAAMKSLKLLKLEPGLGTQGVIVKVNKSYADYNSKWRTHITIMENPSADFDITNLARQIERECVWPMHRETIGYWGGVNENERSYCMTLINRIEDVISSSGLRCIFKTEGKTPLKDKIKEFLEDDQTHILRINLKNIPFEHNAREIVANAIGRYLLGMAREGQFLTKPAVVFLDEAHQFLNRSLGDDNSKYPLDSFSLIAKEGRKYCLTICISTQRPRDIPGDVLSQMGTLIVHRLITDRDREVVERASGEIDKSAAAFLPTLGPGEAIVIGVNFPIPLSLTMEIPTYKPDSQGPQYQTCWVNEVKQEANIEEQNGEGGEEHQETEEKGLIE